MWLKPINKICATLLTIPILWGCAADPSRLTADDQGRKIFRHRWWNYYHRGIASLEEKDHQRAREDLLTALRKRNRDQYMARTYGMHFMDYFPHRELGIVLWEMGRLEEARSHLETSISQTPTAKAYYFLDRVREARVQYMIQRCGEVPPPTIRVHDADDILTRDDPVTISGSITDDNYVASLSVGGKAWYLPGSKQRIDFSQPLRLPDGKHRITVRARGLSGMIQQQQVTVCVDRQGPVVSILSVEKNGGKWSVRGRCLDQSGVAFLTINGKRIDMDSRTIETFNISVLSPEIDFEAGDRLGNITHGGLLPDEVATIGRIQPAIMLASRETLSLLGNLAVRPDRQPPHITLQGWTASQTVYMDKVVIEGSVMDNSQIGSITINQQPVADTSLTGVFVGFSCTVALKEGENTISVIATDTAGNRSIETIIVNRHNPCAHLLEHRLSLTILPFSQQGRITATGDAFQDLFTQQLTLQNRFNIVERTLLETILQEHKISRGNLTTQETALKTGRLLAAHALISGNIVDTRLGVEVIARFVDTETAEILTMEDGFIDTNTASLSGMKQTAEQLAIKLHRGFPVVEGEIVDCQGNSIVTSLGTDQVRAQRRILIVRKKQILHPVTGQPMGQDYELLGRARLVQIQKKFSKGKLCPNSAPGIGPAHGVITQ